MRSLNDAATRSAAGRRYYNLLRRVFLIEELPAWGRNLGSAARRSPKLLFCDSGLLAHVLNFDSKRFERDLHTKPGPGNIFENFVASEILKQASWNEPAVRVSNWRDHNDREIDVVIERRDGSVVALQSTLDATVHEGDLGALIYLRDTLGEGFRGEPWSHRVQHAAVRRSPVGRFRSHRCGLRADPAWRATSKRAGAAARVVHASENSQ